MSTKPHQSLVADLAANNHELDRRLRAASHHMTAVRFRLIELLLAFSTLALAAYGVAEDGDPTLLIGLAIPTAGALAGLKIAELYSFPSGEEEQDGDGG